MKTYGFTLIELSIVLVIIGLIIGGVLVGQDLIGAAALRSTIAQIEKYNSAVNTFRNKYNGIPGDMLASQASQFGFNVAGNCKNGTQGERDGNGLIDGYVTFYTMVQTAGETALFWSDLSTAGFIDGQYPSAGLPAILCGAAQGVALSLTPGSAYVGNYFPTAKIGNGNFIYVYNTNGFNWFGLSAVTSTTTGGTLFSNTNLLVNQAYNLDKKMDDSLPATGNVQAVYLNNSVQFTSTANAQSSDSASSCYNSTTNAYSTNQNNGSNPNCALSFKMQGAAR